MADATPRVPLAVTTNGDCSAAITARARHSAQRWQLPFVERRRKAPLWPLLASRADAFLVFSEQGVALWDREGVLRFQPGIAHLRIKRLNAGVIEDTLVRLAEFREGERVLDCTLGLAQDALVAARAVGTEGTVVGLEHSLALWAVVSEGLKELDYVGACKVRAALGESEAFLRAQPDGAFDCVLIDPMFERPRGAQPSFEALRRYAEHRPLSREMFDEARRVATRIVVVKAGQGSKELARLGLTAEPVSRHASVEWGIWRREH